MTQARLRLDELDEFADAFRARVMQDALSTATASFWRRRANDFRKAVPREDDFPGRAAPNEIAARAARLEETALACEHAAELALQTTDDVGCGCADDPAGEHP